jgi:hypothetical protein
MEAQSSRVTPGLVYEQTGTHPLPSLSNSISTNSIFFFLKGSASALIY